MSDQLSIGEEIKIVELANKAIRKFGKLNPNQYQALLLAFRNDENKCLEFIGKITKRCEAEQAAKEKKV